MVVLLSCTSLKAYQVTLTWDANTEENLAGYKIYYGSISRDYNTVVDVNNVTRYTIEVPDKTYFAATAYNTEGLESDYSDEVFYEYKFYPATNGKITYYDIGEQMSRIFDEKFEGAGYEESGWTESVGSGCTINEDANSSGAGSPANWGSQSLQIVQKAGEANYVYNQIGDGDTRYTRIEVVITDLSGITADSERFYIAAAINNALNELCWYIRAEAQGSDIRFHIIYSLDGSSSSDAWSDDVITEDTLYRIEVEWDSSANNNFEWRINGVMQDQANLVAGNVDMGAISVGYVNTISTVDGEFYVDLVAIDNADWVGAEPGAGWGGKILGVSSISKVNGITIENITKIMGK